MSSIFNLPKVTGLLGLLILALGIWFGAPYFEIKGVAPFATAQARLLICFVIICVVGFLALIDYLNKRQQLSTEEKVEEAEHRKAEVLFKRQAKKVYRKIKGLFPIWRRDHQQLLFNLPWYLVIGEAKSGKTKLLLNSQLDFTNEATREDATLESPVSSKEYAFHFSKQAIFIEAANKPAVGQLEKEGKHVDLVSSSQDPAWYAIIKFLKRYRPFKSIQGVIVTVSLPDLLLKTPDQIVIKQKTLRSTIDLIHAQLKIKVPIYLIFTHLDEIAGFQEFFMELPKEEQEEPWGIYFPDYLFTEKEKLETYFNTEFDSLIVMLNQRILPRLEAERGNVSRRIISYFPHQLELFKSSIRAFLPNTKTSQLRGLFFTSQEQAANANDFVMTAFANKFLVSEPTKYRQMAQQKTYFIQRLVPEVILTDRYRIEKNALIYHRFDWTKERAGQLMAISVLILSATLLSSSYHRNADNIASLKDYLTDYQQNFEKLPVPGNELFHLSSLLESARKMISVNPTTLARWLLNVELYEPLHIRRETDRAFHRVLNSSLLPNIGLHYEHNLQKKTNDVELTYLTLKAYLALSGMAEAKSTWLVPPILHEMSDGAGSGMDNGMESEALSKILPYLEEASKNPMEPLKVNQHLIEQARAYCQSIPLSDVAYYELKQVVEERLLNTNIPNTLGNALDEMFTIEPGLPTVPAMYTFQGYKTLLDEGDNLLDKASILYWILGLARNKENALVMKQLTPLFWARYSRDYIQTWENYLSKIHIVQTNDMTVQLNVLDRLTQHNNPLKKLLGLIGEQTRGIQNKSVLVGQHFYALNQVTDETAKHQQLSYSAVLNHLNGLKKYLNQIAESSNFEQSCFDAAKATIQNQDNAINKLKILKSQAPEPLRHLLDEIVNNSMGVLLSGAHSVVSAQWQSQVAPIFVNELSNRFPFKANTQAEVSLATLGEFFGADGVIDKFLKTYVLPFIDTHQHPWKPYSFGKYTIDIQPIHLAAIEKAVRIQHLYFAGGGKNPAVQFAIRPSYLSSASSDVGLQYGNQTIVYKHGPQQVNHWHWPLADGNEQASIIINDFNGISLSSSYDGTWALFKLFSETKLKPAGGPGHYVWSVYKGHHQASFELWTAKNAPLFDLSLFQSLQLPTKL